MGPVISLHDVGVQFRLNRRNRRRPGWPRRRRWTMWGLLHVSLDVQPGEIVGLIGPNGAGKSTLLRTVAGIYQADEGTATVRGRVAALISPTGGLKPRLSGWQNVELTAILLGLTRQEARPLASRVSELAGLGELMDAPARVYSAGMRTRLGFAIAVASDPDILLLDEVMAAGDEEFRERSEAMLREFIRRGRTVLFATHELSTVADSCDRLVWMAEGTPVEQGDPATVAEHYLRDAQHSGPRLAVAGPHSMGALVREARRR